MQVPVKAGALRAILKSGVQCELFLEATRYRYSDSDDNKDVKIDATGLAPDALKALIAQCEADGLKGALNKLRSFVRLKDDAINVPIKRLESLQMALIQYVGNTPNKWLFRRNGDGRLLPYFVTNIRYQPAETSRGNSTPAYTSISMIGMRCGEQDQENITWEASKLQGKGRTVVEILAEKGTFIETPELVAEYQTDLVLYREHRDLLGHQYTATGQAMAHKLDENYWYGGRWVNMVRDDVPAKVVMDSDTPEIKRTRGSSRSDSTPARFWEELRVKQQKASGEGEVQESENEDLFEGDEIVVEIPVHPYVTVFDLKENFYADIHVNNITAYKWTPELIDKLILPQHHKGLIEVLLDSTDTLVEDIVQGKTGGIIVAATGEAGVGKTLTAEVCSERMQKPLYNVQCSQLGVDVTALEKSLVLVLGRAVRWNAILLLDECDVYVRERGEDLMQNAIVGVFLRVLEYYRGVLFLTSNKPMTLDDAIVSRCTAHIRYILPDNDKTLSEVWDVLSTQADIPIGPALMKELLMDFPPGSVSPRNIKNLLKLVRVMVIKRGRLVSRELFREVSQFVDLAYDDKSWKRHAKVLMN